MEIDKKRLKNLKLIVFDIDGTLVSNEGKIGEETKKLVKELKNLGVKFSLASGRIHSSLIDYAEELQLESPLVSLDGALIKSHSTGKIIYKSCIKKKHVHKALGMADRFLTNITLCHADAIYYTESNSLVPQLVDKFGAKYVEVPSYEKYLEDALEIFMTADNKENLKYIRDRFSVPYSFGINSSYHRSQTNDGIYYLELRKKGNSKGTGLKRLNKFFKISPHNTAVIGDWYNDISLFQPKVLKVAVANAVAELKRMADIITDRTNNEDGVAEFLTLVLNAKKNG